MTVGIRIPACDCYVLHYERIRGRNTIIEFLLVRNKFFTLGYNPLKCPECKTPTEEITGDTFNDVAEKIIKLKGNK